MKTIFQLRNDDGLFLTEINHLRISFSKYGKIYRSLKSAETDLHWYYLRSVGDNIQTLTIVSYTDCGKDIVKDNPNFNKARDFLAAADCRDYASGRNRGMLPNLLMDLHLKGKSFKYIMLLKNDGGLKIDNKNIVGKRDGCEDGSWQPSTMIALDNDADFVYMRMKFSDHLTKIWDENGNLLFNLETEFLIAQRTVY